MFDLKKTIKAAPLTALVLALILSISVQAEEPITVKGKVRNFANPKQSKTISVDVENTGVTVFSYTDETHFENFKSLNELRDETVEITYRNAGSDRVASVITKALVSIPDGVSLIDTAEMASLIKKGPAAANYYLIDTRPAKRYEEGHLPGAVSIPVSELRHNPSLLLPDKNVHLIFYGGGPTCGMSPEAAELARAREHENISIYLPGEPAWKKAGHYTISTVEFVREENVVLIDLRSSEAVEAGHIPGAVSIPAARLPDARQEFPAYRGADIVFYSDNADDLISAVKTAHSWGYRKSTIFLGGTGAWELRGYELAKGPASETIAYERIIPEGEISIQDFEEALHSGNAVILDVRNPAEYAAGHFSEAINIRVDDIASRYSELPEDRKILVYCVTGVRAGMAYTILKEHGYDVRFLNAAPVFSQDGGYEIKE